MALDRDVLLTISQARMACEAMLQRPELNKPMASALRHVNSDLAAALAESDPEESRRYVKRAKGSAKKLEALALEAAEDTDDTALLQLADDVEKHIMAEINKVAEVSAADTAKDLEDDVGEDADGEPEEASEDD